MLSKLINKKQVFFSFGWISLEHFPLLVLTLWLCEFIVYLCIVIVCKSIFCYIYIHTHDNLSLAIRIQSLTLSLTNTERR